MIHFFQTAKSRSKIIIGLIGLYMLSGCKDDPDIITPYPNPSASNYELHCIDKENRVIVYNGSLTEVENNEIEFGKSTFTFQTNTNTLSLGQAYKVLFEETIYTLYKSSWPILSINTNNLAIEDDPKTPAYLTLIENGILSFESNMGVELRGGTSQTYPKKTYSFELWMDSLGITKNKISLLNMRKDDDWILDGMWNEPNRLRDFAAHDIWLSFGRVQNKKSDTKTGIKREYIELFINDKYKGIYYLGEKIDKKQLDLKSYDNGLRGELYKGYTWSGGVTFSSIEDYDNAFNQWSGYEAKYPKKIGEIDWFNLYGLVNTVISSPQDDFNNSIGNQVDIDNAIDYYIFLNLIYASDNTGKNVYTAKLDHNALYFFLPWDMDGSFGTDWTGSRSDITNRMLKNGLFEKLLKYPEFKIQTKERWRDLRTSTITKESINSIFNNNYDNLQRNGLYERERIIYDTIKTDHAEEMQFISSWIDRRIDFMDQYFEEL